jgi:hypothetical protein
LLKYRVAKESQSRRIFMGKAEVSGKIDSKFHTLEEQMVEECLAMAKFALASGLKVPGDIVEALQYYEKPETGQSQGAVSIRQLNLVHNRLSKIVEPAKPRSILLLDVEGRKRGPLHFMGIVPFIRRMTKTSIFCLVLFIGISLTSVINTQINLFEDSGLTLLIKELFLLSAAGLGAGFSALFRATRYIVKGTFDPKYESSYWIRFILGIIAGMILATLIPIGELVKSSADSSKLVLKAGFEKPLLAMAGGFSADLVYRIMARIIEAISSLVRGDASTQVEAKEQQMIAKSSEEDSKNRYKLASDLMKVQEQIDSGSKPEDIKNQLSQLRKQLTGTEDEDSPS